MGLSAGLNHFNDISLTPKYAGICGFSRDEFEGFFREQLAVALESMRGRDSVSADATVAYKTGIISFGERLMHGPQLALGLYKFACGLPIASGHIGQAVTG